MSNQSEPQTHTKDNNKKTITITLHCPTSTSVSIFNMYVEYRSPTTSKSGGMQIFRGSKYDIQDDHGTQWLLPLLLILSLCYWEDPREL